MLYYRLAEHINKYMSVVQYIVSTLSTKVGIQLLTMSVATMRRAHVQQGEAPWSSGRTLVTILNDV